jgi:hypothetical protein
VPDDGRRKCPDRHDRHRLLSPELSTETYATTDIIAYDGVPMVKAGREFLLRKRKDE